jgi:hypothetical protein
LGMARLARVVVPRGWGSRRNYSLLVTDSGGPDSRHYRKEKRRFRVRDCRDLSTHRELLNRTCRMRRECCLVRELGLLRDWRSLRRRRLGWE